jgi:hypothetical protein
MIEKAIYFGAEILEKVFPDNGLASRWGLGATPSDCGWNSGVAHSPVTGRYRFRRRGQRLINGFLESICQPAESMEASHKAPIGPVVSDCQLLQAAGRPSGLTPSSVRFPALLVA